MSIDTEIQVKKGKCWTFSSQDSFEQHREKISELLGNFLKNWKSKNHPQVRGSWTMVEDHFLVIVGDDGVEPISGCNMDALQRFVIKMGEQLGIDFRDRSLFYKDGEGKVHGVSRGDFKAKIKEGEIKESTSVFNTIHTRIEDLFTQGFEVPLKDCWHYSLYKAVA